MPKQKITKEMVVDTAFEIAKESGMEQVLVKTIASRIGCSVQPIYSYCQNMEILRQEVIQKATEYIQSYVTQQIDPQDLFRSTGRAYIHLAKEEPHLFKLFILHERKGISSLDELYDSETDSRTASTIAGQLDISLKEARDLHLNMLIYTIGIGTIFCMTTPGIPPEEIFARQELAYHAFLKDIQSSD